MRRLLTALLCLLVAAGVRAAGDDADEARQQVLVMLRLPPAHFRADGGYGGGYGAGVGRSARRAIAAELARSHGLALVGDWAMPALGVDCYVLAVPPTAAAAPEHVAQALARDARVVWAQPMNVFGGQGARHDDPLYPAQPAALAWRLADLHELASGRRVKVAVVDSGVDAAHPDLAGQVAASEDLVGGRAAAPERHGTAVAGIIAARADDRVGIAGVAPAARLLALRGCWQGAGGATLCTSLGLAKALVAALAHDAAVINLSLSGPPDRLLGRLLDLALARGTTVVTAFDSALPGGGFPATHAGVVAVADSAAAGAWSAPGRDVPVPAPGGRWEFVSGASYASAHVAGLFALLHELGSGGATALVRDAAGGIDTCATLLRAAGPRECACASALALSRPPARP